MPISLIFLVLTCVSGILLGKAFLFFPWSAAGASAALAAFGLLAVRANRLPSRAVLCVFLVAIISALLLIVSVLRLPADHYRRSLATEGTMQEVVGRISSPLERQDDRVSIILAVSAIDRRTASGDLRVVVRDAQPGFGRGDTVRITGRIYPPRSYQNPGGFDYREYLARQGMYAVMSVRKASDIRIESSGTGLLRRIEDLRQRIRQAFLLGTSGDASALLRAMILGDESGITDALRERFMAAGVTHILSISGSHLGLVALLSFWIMRNTLFLLPERHYHRLTLALDPRKAAAIAAALPVTFYALLAGAEVATIRSLIMILAALAALLLHREHDILSALALAALLSIIPDPQAVFDISFQLSYISVAAILFIVSAGNLIDRGPDGWRPRLARSGAMLLAVSAATSIVTAPVVALYFRQISPVGVIANMVIVPLAGAVVVPLGLVAGVLSLFTGTLPLAGLVQTATDTFLSLVAFFAGLPGALVHLPAPGILFLAGYTALLVSGAVLLRAALLRKYRPLEYPGRLPAYARGVMVFAVILLIGVLVLPRLRSSVTRVTYIDVGQGDCALVETAGGCRVLIDGGGTRDNRFDTGARVAGPYLWDRGIRSIDLVVLSHPHPDHMNGLVSLIRMFPVREVWSSGTDTCLEGYDAFSAAVREKHIPIRTVLAGESSTIKDAAISVLHPPRAFPQRSRKAYAAENDRSLVLRVQTGGGRSYLFPGDIHGEGERALLEGSHQLASDVVKVPHHGSKTSSSEVFVNAVRPRAAVIPVGPGNPYRHPAAETVQRYRDAGATVYRTDLDGSVIVRENASGLSFLTGAELALQRIDGGPWGTWGATERDNWKRLWIREWEI